MTDRDRLIQRAVHRAAGHLRRSIQLAMAEDHSQQMIHQLSRTRHDLWQIERFLEGTRPNALEDAPVAGHDTPSPDSVDA